VTEKDSPSSQQSRHKGPYVRLDDDVYQKIEVLKREDETFSEAIDRLTSDWSLAEWGERHAATRAEVADHVDALEALETADREALETVGAID